MKELRRYRDLVENANDIIYEIDRAGFFRFFNPVAVRVTGYPARELQQKHYLDLIRDDCREDARRFYESQCLSEFPSTLYELPLVSKDGTEVWIEQRVQLIRKGDRIQGFHAIARDVTERKRVEVAPRVAVTRTVASVDTAVDGSAAIDAQGLVGKSALMRSVYRRIQEASTVDWTVLIEGETGTGKELVARAVHFSSHRRDKPFIAVNCAGLTESLLSSQLFGHRRGAFTGAVENHTGVFEMAEGGTLLLDEIGDVSMNVQRSLLRVLEDKQIMRLGDSRSRKIDVHVLAATQHDLVDGVGKGRFRADLLYRIRVARITLPPLRERREDIPLLVQTFLGQSRAVTGKPVEDVDEEAMRMLMAYPWRGNVRELKSAIAFATLYSRGRVIGAKDLPPEITQLPAQAVDGLQDERQQVRAALEAARGNRTLAARHLGISRATLYRHLGRLGLSQRQGIRGMPPL